MLNRITSESQCQENLIRNLIIGIKKYYIYHDNIIQNVYFGVLYCCVITVGVY